MRTRFFDLRSGTITWAAGIATITFPRRTRGKARAAIIGIEYQNTDPATSLAVAITAFTVGDRQYVQGDASSVILGLLAPGAQPQVTAGAAQAWAPRPYFPCSQAGGLDGAMNRGHGIPTPDGKFAGGILLRSSEIIQINLTDLAASTPVLQLVLKCVQFDEEPSTARRAKGDLSPEELAFEAWYEQFCKGIGQIHFHGSNAATPAGGAAFQTQIEQTIHSPYNRRCRRLETRGVLNETDGGTVDEAGFQAAFGRFSASDGSPHSLDPIPLRATVGHAHLQYPGAVAVDIEDGDDSIIDLSSPLLASATASTFRLTTILEGQDENAPFLNGPNPF